MMKRFYFLFFLLTGFRALSQNLDTLPVHDERYKDNGILFHITAGGHLPLADMATRFGMSASIGGRIEFISKSNWIIGGEGEFFFGGKVKENPLEFIQLKEGYIIGNDRNPASIYLLERGYGAYAYIGKLFAGKTTRDGLRLCIGGGYMRHKIRLQDDTRTVAQITGDYAKGYDRLTGGPAAIQFFGWEHHGKNRRFNYTIGLEFIEGFTNTMRDWDFAAMRKLDQQRLDVRIGLKIAYFLPFYLTRSEEIYY